MARRANQLEGRAMVVRTYWQGYGWPWRGEECITRLVEARSRGGQQTRAERDAADGVGRVGATRTTARGEGEKQEARGSDATGQRGWASVRVCPSLIQRVSITCTASTRRGVSSPMRYC